jgi:hypothetical protein
MPSVITPCGPSGSSSIPWSLSEAADNVAADFFSGRSPNPLTYKFFTTTDDTAFDFLNTNTPAPNNGDVRILRSGLYLVRLVVSSRLRAAGTDPGYNWDMAVYVQGDDAGGGIYFSPDLFTGGSKVQPVASYATYPSPRDNGGAPNGVSMLGRQEQHVETVSYLNLPDSVVDWPVTITAQFRHGLNDADVTVAPQYILWIFRTADANEDAPTT